MTNLILAARDAILVASCLALVACGDRPDEEPVAGPEPPPGISLPTDGKARPLTPEEQSLVVDQIMRAKAQEQAEGLGSGSVAVNGAWNYVGYSYLAPDPNAAIEARLVAVDLTIEGHTPQFDLDDIEIVDGGTGISYGSDPHATPLAKDGKLLGENDTVSSAPAASRWLLIYAFPKGTPNFHLYYWGQQLTPELVEVGESGFALPYPAGE